MTVSEFLTAALKKLEVASKLSGEERRRLWEGAYADSLAARELIAINLDLTQTDKSGD